MAEPFDNDSLRDFVDEAREHIVALNRDLLELEERGSLADPELVNSTFRAIHTVKGLSGMLGLGSINELSHGMEDALSTVRGGEAVVGGGLAEALFVSLDLLSEMVEAAARGDTGGRDVDGAIGKLSAATAEAGKPEGPQAGGPATGKRAPEDPGDLASYTARGMLVFRVGLSLRRDFASSAKRMLDAIKLLDNVSEVVSVRPKDVEKRLRSRKKTKRSKDIQAELVVATALSEDMLREELAVETVEIEELARPAIRPKDEAGSGASEKSAGSGGTGALQAIRVGVGKLDHILALVGELVIVRSRYNHIAGQALGELAVWAGSSRRTMGLQSELNEVESSMSRTLNELQDAVMKARLVPLGSVFGKFRRAVRDITSRASKRVRFESYGGETELDKKVIDQIGDPLMHLVRNAVDHGIEPPEERRRSGKSPEGCVALSARQEGDRIVLEVADDGRGLDRKRIIQKALERGMLTPEKAREATDREIQEIIAAPGFSTSREVTAVSGRGVGMDVVHSALADLKGTLEVESSFGEGTTFRIRLPLTMAIVDALLVAVGNESYAIAVSSVREILDVGRDSIHQVGMRECFDTDSRVVPLVRLVSALDTPTLEDPSQDDDAPSAPEAGSQREVAGRIAAVGRNGTQTTVIVDSGNEEVGLAVDRVIGQQEIVIKALSRRFEGVAEISGGSVLGDGSVCLILDVPSLVSKAKEEFADVVATSGVAS
ncbi:MAG: chemotaxis protein CheA [Planctomycetota bacterium]